MNLVDKILETKAQGKDSTTPPCHTERSEVSQNIESKRDISPMAQYDKRKKLQNDKIILVYKLYELDSHEIQIIEN